MIDCGDNKHLANSFVQYFDGKVSKIRCSLDAKVVDVASLASFQAQPQVHNCNFSAFAEVSEEDVLQVVKNQPLNLVRLTPYRLGLLRAI